MVLTRGKKTRSLPFSFFTFVVFVQIKLVQDNVLNETHDAQFESHSFYFGSLLEQGYKHISFLIVSRNVLFELDRLNTQSALIRTLLTTTPSYEPN